MAEDVIQYSRMITLNDKPIFKNNTADADIKNKVNKIDRDWIKSAFMVSGADLDPIDEKNRYFSTANIKFTDTTMGGNIGINSRPQFTRYADIRVQGRRMDRLDTSVTSEGNLGMGRYYSEAIDDNSHNLYLQFGVPKFNSLFTFFTRSIDYKTSVVAATGRSPFFYDLGSVIGSVAIFLVVPVISISIWAIKTIVDIVTSDSSFNFYYMNPTMHTYWLSVNTIVTHMASELGILIPEFMSGGGHVIGTPAKMNDADMAEMRKLLPDIITDNNMIDVFAIANRAQLMANKQLELEAEQYKSFKGDKAGAVGFLKGTVTSKVMKEPANNFKDWLKKTLPMGEDLFNGPKKAGAKQDSENPPPAPVSNPKELLKANADGTYTPTAKEKKENNQHKISEYFKSSFRGGGQHAIFKVDYVGSISESFSNSVTDVPAGAKLKSVAKAARSANFSFAGGNIAGGVGNVVNAVKDTAAGALDSMSFGLSNIIPTLFGGAYIDVPKMWDDSSASFPKLNYTMQLVSPYGNTISQLQNMYIPLAMILAGTLPLSTGKASYTSPFLCSAFLKGMHNVKLGMITDLSITRGTSNLAYNKQKRVLALDVSFSITDLSQLMVAPMDASLFGSFKSGIDNDAVFGRYISTLTSRDLLTDMYAIPKAKMKLSRLMQRKDVAFSSSYWGFRTGEFANSIFGGFAADQSLSLSDTNK